MNEEKKEGRGGGNGEGGRKTEPVWKNSDFKKVFYYFQMQLCPKW